ncbi:YARHG domain-containing protein [candidate division WOR-3 bacterium]|nr:YARHG domain-containing protein [candidate division WOR-3 bacterium]
MKRVVFFMLALLFVSISMYGDIGRGDWTQDEINYFKKKEYIGNYKYYFYDYSIQYPPYSMEMTEGEYIGYGPSDSEILSKIIVTGKIAEEDEFRYLSLLRNEMYARNGYIFKDAGLKAFFNQMPWYKPISEDIQLNAYERTNLRGIKRLEKEIKDILQNKQKEFEFANRYEKKIIIKAKWGEGECEFKLLPINETLVYRALFAISPKDNNLYILDHNNFRINIFNKDGKFVKHINLPSEYIYKSKYSKTCLVEAIGVDKNNNIYIVKILYLKDSNSQIISEIDNNGKIINQYIIENIYGSSLYFYVDSNNELYIWGNWYVKPPLFITAIIPMELIKNRTIELNKDYINSISIGKTRILKLDGNRIKLADINIIGNFNIYKDSILICFNGDKFIYQDFKGEIKDEFDKKLIDYPGLEGINYREYQDISVNSTPIIDKDLNIYCITGDSKYLKVIKYEFKK